MNVVDINGEVREVKGKRELKKLRREGKIPCELYGGDDNIHFSLTLLEVKDLVYTSEFKLANVVVDGVEYRCILKDIQFHPVTDDILHIDFQELVADRKVKVEVPVRFVGSSPGIKNGGKLIQKVRKIKLKTTPEHLIDHVTLDISGVSLGQSVRVRDIEVDDRIQIMNNPGIPVASVEVPRALRSIEEEEAEAEELAEGEEGVAEEVVEETAE